MADVPITAEKENTRADDQDQPASIPRREVTQVSTRPTSASEALDMVRAGLGYLAAADATAMAADTQAQCLQALEQVSSVGTAQIPPISAQASSALLRLGIDLAGRPRHLQ